MIALAAEDSPGHPVRDLGDVARGHVLQPDVGGPAGRLLVGVEIEGRLQWFRRSRSQLAVCGLLGEL
jgi:hypothetical protein